MHLRRRDFIAAGACTCAFTGVRAAGAPPSGAVGLICTAAGIAGLDFQGEDGVVLDPTFRWHIGSNTKAMTAALYARLVERRRLRWHATIADLFPSIAVHPAWSSLLVEDLLGHTSGLTDGFVDGDWLDARRADPASPRAQRHALAARVLSHPPPERPGVYRYGNLNYVLIGAAIEEATGSDWEKVIQDDLFAPLHMGEVGFGAPPPSGPWGRSDVGGKLTAIDPRGIADNPPVLWPSGGVHLSPASYARFLGIFLRDGAPLLQASTVARLLTPPSPDGRYAGGWSLEGPTGAAVELLAHNGSNSFWFTSALIDRPAGRAYAGFANKGGAEGEATTTRMIGGLRVRASHSD